MFNIQTEIANWLHTTVQTPLGPFVITQDDNSIISLSRGKSLYEDKTQLLEKSAAWLQSFFENPLEAARFPYHYRFLHKTNYQKRIFQYVISIPAGQTRTYSQLAEQCGGSARSAGNAVKRNPLLFIVPCHRIVGKKNIGGYSGPYGVKGKEWLLKRERIRD